ncbi:hypothetical protein LXL04_039614 [Taraxacum kok-saghyz]
MVPTNGEAYERVKSTTTVTKFFQLKTEFPFTTCASSCCDTSDSLSATESRLNLLFLIAVILLSFSSVNRRLHYSPHCERTSILPLISSLLSPATVAGHSRYSTAGHSRCSTAAATPPQQLLHSSSFSISARYICSIESKYVHIRLKEEGCSLYTKQQPLLTRGTLKRIGVNAIPPIVEVNIFKDETVIQFLNPKVQASEVLVRLNKRFR